MKRPGEKLDCPYCGDPHVVKENDEGFAPDLDVRRFYVECPTLDGNINWAVIVD